MAEGISPDTGAPIDGVTAKKWMDNYKAAHTPDVIIAHFFGDKIINQVLAQPDCIGMRCYYALDDKGVKQMLLVGVNSTGNNIWDLASAAPDQGGLIADFGAPCPYFCPEN